MGKSKLRIQVIESCNGYTFWFGIIEGKKIVMTLRNLNGWRTKSAATRNAKAMAKELKIPFDENIHKIHGC